MKLELNFVPETYLAISLKSLLNRGKLLREEAEILLESVIASVFLLFSVKSCWNVEIGVRVRVLANPVENGLDRSDHARHCLINVHVHGLALSNQLLSGNYLVRDVVLEV